MNLILHITTYKEWAKAQEEGVYETDSLGRQGFIDCSQREQILGVANSMHHGRRGLVLLVIDADQLEADVRYEDCYQTGSRFPHVYGPLNLEAVISVIPFPPDDDGKFTLPQALAGDTSSLRCNYPILEFDPAREALIEPGHNVSQADLPERCVLCFFQEVINALQEEGRLTLVTNLVNEIGGNPVFTMEVDGLPLTICHPGVGAPLASGTMEELIARGCRTFIICGGAGVLDGRLGVGHVIVPPAAVRDEGTSYHYLPPAREVEASARAVAAVEKVLQRDNVDYVVGKTWTTDGVYRETPGKIQLRRAEGCIAVEMEAAAFFAVARFRSVTAAQILYAGDDVSSEQWDSRHWDKQTGVREKIFWLAVESCLEC